MPPSPVTLLEILGRQVQQTLPMADLQTLSGMEPSRYLESLKSLRHAGQVAIEGDPLAGVVRLTLVGIEKCALGYATLSPRADDRRQSMADDPSASPLWPADNPGVMAHMGALQGIINRLANNSASCKTWCLTLVSALIGLAGATHVPEIVAFALLPVVVFGFMDTLYLAQEKAYRDLYTRTANAIQDRSYVLGSAFEARADCGFGCVCWALTSWSIWPVYAGLIAVYVVARYAGWLTLLAATKQP